MKITPLNITSPEDIFNSNDFTLFGDGCNDCSSMAFSCDECAGWMYCSDCGTGSGCSDCWAGPRTVPCGSCKTTMYIT